MANAIRAITVERGLDPREFVLVAFGGAGPMHAAFLADELEIPMIVVPKAPGNFSAFGMLQTDIRHDVVEACYCRMPEATMQFVGGNLSQAEERATRMLAEEGLAPEQMSLLRAAEMRYVGQEYALQIPFPSNRCDEAALAQLPDLFHRAHQARYGHSNPSETVELVNLRLSAIGYIDKPPLASLSEKTMGEPRSVAERPVYFDGAPRQSAVYMRSELRPGHAVLGPAIVEEESSTTVVPPGHSVTVDALGNLVLQIQSAASKRDADS
jgi:N-methylhydantoinase A